MEETPKTLFWRTAVAGICKDFSFEFLILQEYY